MAAEDLIVSTADGDMGGYLAKPETPGPFPSIVVIQEIFGVNGEMRRICDGYAEAGFLAACPDLFWRIEPGIELTDQTEAEWKQAFDYMGRFDVDAGVKDIQMTLAALRMRDDTDGHVGTVGFCLGGLLAYLSACRTNGDAHVGYYGVNIDKHMDEAGAISAPVLLHVAGEDEFVDKEAQAKILDMAEKHQHITAFHYPGRGHAFARVGGAHYHKDDAETADARTLAFFREHLG